ncbi:MAG: GNAT family N-acetyltransferase [Nocardioidaceae bacterium]
MSLPSEPTPLTDLPDGLSARALAPGDATAVFEVMAAQQQHDLGRVEIEEADIVGDWQRPSFDVGASTVGVFDGDTMVAYAEVGLAGRGDAAVHPSYGGRGIGTALARWMQANARGRGFDVIGMPVPQGSPGDRLLEALGYHVRWTSWVLQLPEGAEIADRPVPEGYVVREATPEDYRAAHDVVEDAFLEWSVREREDFDDFAAETVLRPGFEPWNFRVVTAPDGQVVGTSIVFLAPDGEAFVSRLATRADQRHRGLAQALLVDSFRAAREHGARRSGLSTDSRTGALGLYEKVGMVVTDVWVNRAVALGERPAG